MMPELAVNPTSPLVRDILALAEPNGIDSVQHDPRNPEAQPVVVRMRRGDREVPPYPVDSVMVSL